MNTSKKGFTLIELLVVIAIIGILSAIVLAFLSGSRDQALDSSIKTNLNQLAKEAELFYSDHYRYIDDIGGVPSNCGDSGFQSCLNDSPLNCSSSAGPDNFLRDPQSVKLLTQAVTSSGGNVNDSPSRSICRIASSGGDSTWAVA